MIDTVFVNVIDTLRFVDTVHIVDSVLVASAPSHIWEIIKILIQIVLTILAVIFAYRGGLNAANKQIKNQINIFNRKEELEKQKQEDEKWANLQLFLTYLKNQQLKINTYHIAIFEQNMDPRTMLNSLLKLEIMEYTQFISLLKPFASKTNLLSPLEATLTMYRAYNKSYDKLVSDDLRKTFLDFVKDKLNDLSSDDLNNLLDKLYDNRRSNFNTELQLLKPFSEVVIDELDIFIKSYGTKGFVAKIDPPVNSSPIPKSE